MNQTNQGQNWPIIIATASGAAILLYEYFSTASTNRAIKREEEQKQKSIEQQNKEAQYTYTFKKVANGRTLRTYSVNLYTLAAQIHDALHGSWFTEDEARVIALLKDITPEYMRRLSFCYLDKFGKNLRTDLVRYLSNSDQDQIRSYLNAL